MAGDPFATAADLVEVWRPLTDEEEARADALLARASRMIRARWSDVDDRITAGTLDADLVADVVLEMVQVAMQAPAPGVLQTTEGAGPFNLGVRYANPSGRLYFTDDMLAVFDGLGATVRMGWLA